MAQLLIGPCGTGLFSVVLVVLAILSTPPRYGTFDRALRY